MRVSTNYQYTSSVGWIDKTIENVQYYQAQVSSGKSFQTISENPYAATQSLKLRSVLSSISQYSSNITSTQTSLNTAESALDEMNTLAKQANSLAISAANATTSQSTRTNYISQISTIQERLVALANSTGASGQYIFAGQKNDKEPFTAANGTLTFNGDTNNVNAEVGPSTTMSSNTDISSLMVKFYGQLETFKTDLASGSTAQISNTDIANTSAASDAFIQLRGDVGSKISSLKELASQNSQRKVDVTSNLSDNEDVDLTEAVTKYQAAQTAYQAALQVASLNMKTSLMDYIS